MDDVGLKNSAETGEKQDVGEKLTPNPTPTRSANADLKALVDAWPLLDDATKAKIVELMNTAVQS